MTAWQIVRIIAGALTLLSLALGAPSSPFFANEWWLALAAFVGLNMLQSGITQWCLSERLLRKLGAREGC